MERLTHIADFGMEDWEETLFLVPSDPAGAYNILDIARHQGEPEFNEILKNISLRLAAYEDTGLEPEEIEQLKGEVFGLRVDKQNLEQVKRDFDGLCEYIDSEGFLRKQFCENGNPDLEPCICPSLQEHPGYIDSDDCEECDHFCNSWRGGGVTAE